MFSDQIRKEIANIYLQFQTNFSTQDFIGWYLMLYANSRLNRRSKFCDETRPTRVAL
jgi:hypothetical protein